MNKIRMIALAACMAATLDASAQEQEIRLFSHRGGRMEHDENTLSAFQASYDAGYRGFETDIRMTRDGALVITHDSSLERTTDGTGTVEEKTEAEIRRLRTKQGNKVLFLDELLDALDPGDAHVLADLHRIGTPRGDHLLAGADVTAGIIGLKHLMRLTEQPREAFERFVGKVFVGFHHVHHVGGRFEERKHAFIGVF